MRNLMRTTALLTAIIITATAMAQSTATIGKQVPDIKLKMGGKDGEETYLFRELRGSISLFYFWRPSNLASVEMLSDIKDLHANYSKKGVRFISATAEKDERMQKVLDDKNIDCFEKFFYDGNLIHAILGAYSDPYVVLVDPRGKLAWRGLPDNKLEDRLVDLIERTNPPLGNPDWLDRHYRKAEKFYDQGEYGRAYTIALGLFNMTGENHAMHGRAGALMTKCSEGAEQQLREAVQAERDKKYEEAARIVAEIAVRFQKPDKDQNDKDKKSGGSRDENDESIQRKAELEIGRMNSIRELKKLIREATENAEGERWNDIATVREEDEYFIDAKQLYEYVVKKYDKTDAAKEAKRRIRRIERDKGIQRKLAEQRATDEAYRWLDIAERYVSIKMYDEAREHYQKVIDNHPDTDMAERAKKALKGLPKSKKTDSKG